MYGTVWTVVVVLLCSCVVCLFVVPPVGSRFSGVQYTYWYVFYVYSGMYSGMYSVKMECSLMCRVEYIVLWLYSDCTPSILSNLRSTTGIREVHVKHTRVQVRIHRIQYNKKISQYQ